MKTLFVALFCLYMMTLSSNDHLKNSLVAKFIDEVKASNADFEVIYEKYFQVKDDEGAAQLAIEYLKLLNQDLSQMVFNLDNIVIKEFNKQTMSLNLSKYLKDRVLESPIQLVIINGKEQFLFQSLDNGKLRILLPLNSGKKGFMII